MFLRLCWRDKESAWDCEWLPKAADLLLRSSAGGRDLAGVPSKSFQSQLKSDCTGRSVHARRDHGPATLGVASVTGTGLLCRSDNSDLLPPLGQLVGKTQVVQRSMEPQERVCHLEPEDKGRGTPVLPTVSKSLLHTVSCVAPGIVDKSGCKPYWVSCCLCSSIYVSRGAVLQDAGFA